MKVLVLVVVWLAIVVALPTNRIKGSQEDAPIRRAKRADSMGMNLGGFNYGHSFDVYQDENIDVSASVSAFKSWLSDKFSADSMSAQLDMVHKKTGIDVFIGADHGRGDDYMMRIGSSYDILNTNDIGLGISGQYNMDYNPNIGTFGGYGYGLNGRYRTFSWDVDKDGVSLHQTSTLAEFDDKTLVADIDVEKGWVKENWKTHLPDVLTGRLQFVNNKNHVSAFVGLNKVYHKGGSIFTGLRFPLFITDNIRAALSTGYSWTLGGDHKGLFSLDLNANF